MANRSKYRVTFKAAGIGSVSPLLDEQPPQPSETSGWDVVSRPRRKGLTIWNGQDPIRWSIPVLFDGLAEQDGQEIEISRLTRMARPDGDEPPTITVSGDGVQSPGPTRWVIESLSWGTNVVQGTGGSGSTVRFRQDCVVNLMEKVDEDRLPFKGGGGSKSSGGWPKHYVVKNGDTLSKIAVKFYHNASKWKQIAKANNIRDPKSVKVGRNLIIPKP